MGSGFESGYHISHCRHAEVGDEVRQCCMIRVVRSQLVDHEWSKLYQIDSIVEVHGNVFLLGTNLAHGHHDLDKYGVFVTTFTLIGYFFINGGSVIL